MFQRLKFKIWKCIFWCDRKDDVRCPVISGLLLAVTQWNEIRKGVSSVVRIYIDFAVTLCSHFGRFSFFLTGLLISSWLLFEE